MCLCEDPGGAEAVERVAPGCPRQPCPARRAASVAPAAQRTGIRARSGTPPGAAWKERESKVRRAAFPSFSQLRPLRRRRRPAARRVPSAPRSGGN